jgi:hypothetical protein
MCHVGNVGTPGWNPKVILTDRLPPEPAGPAPTSTSEPSDAGAAPSVSDAGIAPADAAVMDGG